MSEPISLLVPCAIIAAACIPLMLNAVPPNRIYGVRTRQTLGDRQTWFRVNRFAGWVFFVAAGLSALVFRAQPEYASGRSAIGLAVLVVPLVVALLACLAYLRRLPPRA